MLKERGETRKPDITDLFSLKEREVKTKSGDIAKVFTGGTSGSGLSIKLTVTKTSEEKYKETGKSHWVNIAIWRNNGKKDSRG